MSFFFIEQERKQAKSPKGKPTPVDRQQVETLHRLQCQVCPLAKSGAHTPKMAPTFGDGPIYFLAEAPGRDEDENSGKPLTGPSGRLLRECLPHVEWTPSYDNVVNCRPQGNRTPTWAEIECCRPRRWQYVEAAKPKLIVGLGAIPTMAVLGSADLAGLRGRFFAVQVGSHACWFMPTYHPSYVLRKAENKPRPLNSYFGHCLRMDIERAYAAVDHLTPPQIESETDARAGIEIFNSSSKLDALLALMDRAKAAKVKAIDIETRGLRPYSDRASILSAAISFNGNCNFAFAADHPQAVWTEPQKELILTSFAQLLQNDTIKVAHNAPFELEWLAWLYGPEIVRHDVWECTMMQAHFLDERRGNQWDDSARASKYQGLDWLIRQHFGLAFKGNFKLNKKDMSKVPIEELLTYNAADTKYTLKLWHRQNQLLKADDSYQAYQLALPTQPTVALMQHLGVDVDQGTVKQFEAKLDAEVNAIDFNINGLKVVKQYEADRGSFNHDSQPQQLVIFRDYLKCKEVYIGGKSSAKIMDFDKDPEKKKKYHEHGQTQQYSVDKSVLAQIDHPLAALILNRRNKTKLRSTYVDILKLEGGSVIYPDGKLHTNFNSTATETGRLSSDGPNLQNFPKRADSWVRGQIVPPRGYTMLAVDYGQLEACTGAMCSRDTYLVKALWDDYDIHMEWAKLVVNEKPQLIGGANIRDRHALKHFRSLIKNKLVFPAFYGASNDSIAQYLSAACDYDVDVAYIDTVMDRFWRVLSGMKKWQDNLVKQYYETGYVTTLGGRKHRYPLRSNQAINHPFQGTAAELVCDAMNRLSMLAVETGKWYLHPILNIHDDLTFCVPDAKLDTAVEEILKEMLVFDFSWINVPLSAEVSIGKNWADLQPLGKFWSHHEFGYPHVVSKQVPASNLQRRARSEGSSASVQAGY